MTSEPPECTGFWETVVPSWLCQGPEWITVSGTFSQASGCFTRQEKEPMEKEVLLWNPSNRSAQCRRCPMRARGRYLPVSKNTLQFSDRRHYLSVTVGQKFWASASLMDGFSDEDQPSPQSLCTCLQIDLGQLTQNNTEGSLAQERIFCLPRVLVGNWENWLNQRSGCFLNF